MTERVYLHVGGPKSGTTYLQGILRGQRETLAAHGVLVAGPAHVDLVHAAMVLREDPRLDRLPERARGAWDRVVADVRAWDGDAAVVSYELLSNLTAESCARALADLEGLEVHVVITARDLGRAISSAWQERLKFGLDEPLESYRPKPDTAVGSEWGWRTLDPASVAARWGATLAPEHVHVVTVPRAGADPGELWRRFAEACDLGAVPLDPVVRRANESLGVEAAEVLRRTNPHLEELLRTPREKAVWERDLLANTVLAGLGGDPLGLTVEQHREAEERYAACVAALTAAGHAVHGDLADLAPAAGDVERRTPGQVGDAEVAEVACRALAALLGETRAREAAREDTHEHGAPDGSDGEHEVGSGPGHKVRTALAGVMSRPVLAENQRLHARIDELEHRLDQSRRLQQRQAMLTDLVTELLVPLAEQRPGYVKEYLRWHRGLHL